MTVPVPWSARREAARGDLRLAWPAVAGLGASLLAAGRPAGVALALAVLFAGLALAGLCWGLWWAPRRAGADRVALGVISLGFAVAAVACGVQAAQARAIAVHPLSGLTGGRTGVLAEVRDFARPIRGGGRLVPVTVHEVRVPRRGPGADLVLAELATVVLAREGWAEVVPGERVRFSAEVLEPREPGETPALRALGGPHREAEAGPTGRVPAAAREDFREVAEGTLGHDDAVLLPSLVLGDESRVPERERERFRAAGLAHLSAVSGANTTFVVGAAVLLAGMCGAGRLGRPIAGALGLAAFVAVVGPQPAVIRAAGTGVVALLALGSARTGRPLAALSAVVLAVVLLSPSTATGAGFLLSVTATAGLVVAARPCSRVLRRRRLPAPVADTLAVCVVAQVVNLPVIVLTGLGGGPWSLLANLAAAPVVPPVTVLGTAAATLAPVWPFGARMLCLPCEIPLWWLRTVAEVVAGLPGSPHPAG